MGTRRVSHLAVESPPCPEWEPKVAEGFMPRPERMHADGAGNGEAANRKPQRMGLTVSTTRTIGVRVMLVRLGHSKDVVAGQMRVFDVAGTKVNVASVDGHLYAFDDTCTHAGCSLAMGNLEGTTVTCACHGSRFDVTSGAVLRRPATRPLRSRLVRVEGEN